MGGGRVADDSFGHYRRVFGLPYLVFGHYRRVFGLQGWQGRWGAR